MHRTDSSLITAAMGDIHGKYRIQTQVTGNYLLRFSFIGYDEYWKPVEISRGNIHAGYLTFRNRNGGFSYLAGLRAEYTDSKSWQESGLREGFMNDDNFQPPLDTTTLDRYFNVFPSLFLSYNIGKNQDVQLSYSRRIQRPGAGSLMPFINVQDFFNLRLGNPYLEPAFTHNSEINYIQAWTNNPETQA